MLIPYSRSMKTPIHTSRFHLLAFLRLRVQCELGLNADLDLPSLHGFLHSVGQQDQPGAGAPDERLPSSIPCEEKTRNPHRVWVPHSAVEDKRSTLAW